MHSAVVQFRENLVRVRALGGLYEALCRLVTPAIDATDLLRAQIVMGVSALDHYIHEITRLGMLEVLSGSRPRTNAFLRFQVTMDAAMAGLSGGGGISWFEDQIREKHGYLAFQHPDTIADAIRLFSSYELWPLVCTKLGLTVQDVKTRLRLIVERRNKIVHEADLDPSYPGARWPIDPVMVAETVDFIENLCEAIHSTVVRLKANE
jgi:hypothetical protein